MPTTDYRTGDTSHNMIKKILFMLHDSVAPSFREVNTSGSLQGGGDLSDDLTLSLVGDSAAPGPNRYYGTNGAGTKGFYPFGASLFEGSVDTAADLPTDITVAPVGSLYVVLQDSGTWFVNRKEAGSYSRVGSAGTVDDWVRLGDFEDMMLDSHLLIRDDADQTKTVQFQLSNLSTASNRLVEFQDRDGTLAYLDDLTTLHDSLAGVALSGHAADLTYDPTTSGLSATDVQAAIDELKTLVGGGGGGGTWGSITGTLSAQTDLAGALSAKADSSSLATVATSGAYADLSGRPVIPAAQVNSDWTSSSGLSQILNKPALATVATSGAYSDLTGNPVVGTDIQAYDAELAAIAGLTSAADKVPYFTGSGTAALATLTSFGRSLIANTTSAGASTTLGLGTASTLAYDTDTTLAAASDARIATQAAIKAYVDNIATGLAWKGSVRAATTANITLSGTQTIDGVSLSVGDRVLVKNQTTGSQNGIYVVASGSWVRSSDADTGAELVSATVMVREGTTEADTQWTCSNDSITIGTTSVTFSQVAGAGTYTADNSTLQISSNVFSIKDAELLALAGLTSAADQLPYFTGSGTASLTTLSSYGRTLIDDTDAVTARTTLGLAIGTNVQSYSSELAALAGNGTNGFWARTGSGAGSARTLTGTSNQISISNGNGASGNPTFSLPQDINTTSTPTFAGLNLNGDLEMGLGGTGAAVSVLEISGGSSSGGGAYIAFDRNGIPKNYIGASSALHANGTEDLDLVSAANINFYPAGSKVATFASTGLEGCIIGAATPAAATFTTLVAQNTTLDDGTGAYPAIAPAASSSQLRLFSSSLTRMFMSTFGGDISVNGLVTGGTRASPAASANGRVLRYEIDAWDGVAAASYNAATFDMRIDGNHSTSNHAGYFAFNGVPNGGTTAADWLWIKSGWLRVFPVTAPTSNPATGVYLYCDAADNKLKARGSSGTITTLAIP